MPFIVVIVSSNTIFKSAVLTPCVNLFCNIYLSLWPAVHFVCLDKKDKYKMRSFEIEAIFVKHFSKIDLYFGHIYRCFEHIG